MNGVFYAAGVVAVIATLLLITRQNAVHALLYLIVSLLSVALVFYSLGAPFVAVLEVIIYAGAIMVLFLFAIMMLNLGSQADEEEQRLLQPATWLGPAILVLVLAAELLYAFFGIGRPPATAQVIEPQAVGAALFGPYVLAAELVSILLLAGLVSAFHLGRRARPGEKGGDR